MSVSQKDLKARHTERSWWSNEPMRELDKTIVLALFLNVLINVNIVKDPRQRPVDKAVYTLRAKRL